MMTDQEQQAITTWLARNKVTRCPLGASGIYDEFGVPLAMTPRAYSRIAQKVRVVLKTNQMTVQELARRLEVRETDVRTACARHRIEVRDAGAPVQKRSRRRKPQGADQNA